MSNLASPKRASIVQRNKSALQTLQADIKETKTRLLSHGVYQSLNSLEKIALFSSHHIFAVWDFMALLKSLQKGLTCVEVPWKPVGTPTTRYLINEIVLNEECDVDLQGRRVSHYELYLQAMAQLGADPSKMSTLLGMLNEGCSIWDALEKVEGLPDSIKQFVSFTMDVALNQPIHVKAAVFTLGREDLIPDMFLEILNKLESDHPDKISIFKYYIERHIEVDGGDHSVLALDMISELCGNDAQKWKEATEFSIKSLEMRIILWDGVLKAVNAL